MAASISTPNAATYRSAWETYANQEVSKIHKMSHEERTQSIDRLRSKCVSSNHGLPEGEAEALLQYKLNLKEFISRNVFFLVSICGFGFATYLSADTPTQNSHSTNFDNQRVFNINDWFQVPDQTLVAPFLNSKDCMSSLPYDLLDGFSIAAGEISSESLIHTLPLVTQVTFVLSGRLEVTMKNIESDHHTVDILEPKQAILTKPGAFIQFRNAGNEPCQVLYIVSPAYLFEMGENGEVIYDDALIVQENWDDLRLQQWQPIGLIPLQEQKVAREESLQRVAKKKRLDLPL